MISDDTIIAFSSPPAPSARIILRLSGAGAFELAGGGPPPSLKRVRLRPRGLEIDAWLYAFAGPRSYTGEDVAELHLPGNVLIARWVMEELIRRGARPAEPGEFTARAYFHGRMDLSEAEGVAAVIGAHNERQLQAARRLMSGELARRLEPIMEQVARTLALTEVGIDFSEEDVTFLSHRQTRDQLDEIDRELEALIGESRRLTPLGHEPRIVLAGRPNAGKSTLLNALSGRQRAVVSPIAGTTRDLLSADIALENGMAMLIDAAGVEDGAPDAARVNHSDPADMISDAMRRKALRAIEEADILLLVREVTDRRPLLSLNRKPDLIVMTKLDLDQSAAAAEDGSIAVSARDNLGMDQLAARLDELAFGAGRGGETLALNDRHLSAIADARKALDRAGRVIEGGDELIALELREALDCLGTILGTVAPDELLGRIFSTFCIGK